MARDSLYGSAHQNKWPHEKRVFDLFQEYEKKWLAQKETYGWNNLLVDLRNEVTTIIDETYQQLAIQLKHNLSIPSSRRKSILFAQPPEQTPCQICGETRVTNVSHIIPRELGGSESDDNIISLCANHHYLFDQVHLTEEEFSKIDVSDKAADSIQYFKIIHLGRHRMYWKYGVNKMGTCRCGNLDYEIDVWLNGSFIEPCLKCPHCGDKLVLRGKHPLPEEVAISIDTLMNLPDSEEKSVHIREIEDKVRAIAREKFVHK
ncbi:MAG: HNH endonuclease [Ignavibacteriales bacterium]|nr:HNH endonuclease [Ignavibacteriales bacterium]